MNGSVSEQEATAEKPSPAGSAGPSQEAPVGRLRGGGRTRKRQRTPDEERVDAHAHASTSSPAAPSDRFFKPGDHVEVQRMPETAGFFTLGRGIPPLCSDLYVVSVVIRFCAPLT